MPYYQQAPGGIEALLSLAGGGQGVSLQALQQRIEELKRQQAESQLVGRMTVGYANEPRQAMTGPTAPVRVVDPGSEITPRITVGTTGGGQAMMQVPPENLTDTFNRQLALPGSAPGGGLNVVPPDGFPNARRRNIVDPNFGQTPLLAPYESGIKGTLRNMVDFPPTARKIAIDIGQTINPGLARKPSAMELVGQETVPPVDAPGQAMARREPAPPRDPVSGEPIREALNNAADSITRDPFSLEEAGYSPDQAQTIRRMLPGMNRPYDEDPNQQVTRLVRTKVTAQQLAPYARMLAQGIPVSEIINVIRAGGVGGNQRGDYAPVTVQIKDGRVVGTVQGDMSGVPGHRPATVRGGKDLSDTSPIAQGTLADGTKYMTFRNLSGAQSRFGGGGGGATNRLPTTLRIRPPGQNTGIPPEWQSENVQSPLKAGTAAGDYARLLESLRLQSDYLPSVGRFQMERGGKTIEDTAYASPEEMARRDAAARQYAMMRDPKAAFAQAFMDQRKQATGEAAAEARQRLAEKVGPALVEAGIEGGLPPGQALNDVSALIQGGNIQPGPPQPKPRDPNAIFSGAESAGVERDTIATAAGNMKNPYLKKVQENIASMQPTTAQGLLDSIAAAFPERTQFSKQAEILLHPDIDALMKNALGDARGQIHQLNALKNLAEWGDPTPEFTTYGGSKRQLTPDQAKAAGKLLSDVVFRGADAKEAFDKIEKLKREYREKYVPPLYKRALSRSIPPFTEYWAK